jgi:hypothetical protein
MIRFAAKLHQYALTHKTHAISGNGEAEQFGKRYRQLKQMVQSHRHLTQIIASIHFTFWRKLIVKLKKLLQRIKL